jgi:hypothetical protein
VSDPVDDVVHELLAVPFDGDPAELLDELYTVLTDYVVFPTVEAAVAFTLWIAATHAQRAWEHATRFVVKSPIKRCGKTRAQECARELVHQPLSTTNISVAALVRSIDEDDPPTLVLDEADAIFGRSKKDRPEGAEDLRGIFNSGHSRGWPYIRWDVASRRRDECPTFAMALIGGIGDMPDTIEDRAVVVSMRRRARHERVKQFRRRRVVPKLHEVRGRLHSWVDAHLDELGNTVPDVPVEDRAADVWEPLIAIADLAGGEWPSRARAACLALVGAGAPDEATAGERLLADLYDIWSEDEEHLATATILERLADVEEAPWGDWYGKPLTARGLARLLRPYGVRSRNIRIGPDTPKGYARADLLDAWTRYTHSSATSATPPHEPETGAPTSPNGCGGSVADSNSESATRSDQPKRSDVADVADVAEPGVNGATDGGRQLTEDEARALFETEFDAIVVDYEVDP